MAKHHHVQSTMKISQKEEERESETTGENIWSKRSNRITFSIDHLDDMIFRFCLSMFVSFQFSVQLCGTVAIFEHFGIKCRRLCAAFHTVIFPRSHTICTPIILPGRSFQMRNFGNYSLRFIKPTYIHTYTCIDILFMYSIRLMIEIKKRMRNVIWI